MMNLKNPVVSTLILLLVLAMGAAVYFYFQFTALQKNPQAAAQKEVTALVGKVSRLIVLPEGEQPTVATVSDPERLKDQPFFAKAKQGDRVLIFTNAKKVILYDPVADKVVDVGPVNIGASQQPETSEQQQGESKE